MSDEERSRREGDERQRGGEAQARAYGQQCRARDGRAARGCRTWTTWVDRETAHKHLGRAPHPGQRPPVRESRTTVEARSGTRRISERDGGPITTRRLVRLSTAARSRAPKRTQRSAQTTGANCRGTPTATDRCKKAQLRINACPTPILQAARINSGPGTGAPQGACGRAIPGC